MSVIWALLVLTDVGALPQAKASSCALASHKGIINEFFRFIIETDVYKTLLVP